MWYFYNCDSQDSGMSRWASERFTAPLRLIRCLMNCYVVWFKEKHTQYLADKSLFKPWMLTDVFSGIFFGLVEHFTHVLFVSHTHRLKKERKKGAVDNVNSTRFSLSNRLWIIKSSIQTQSLLIPVLFTSDSFTMPFICRATQKHRHHRFR